VGNVGLTGNGRGGCKAFMEKLEGKRENLDLIGVDEK
jgi:hypothetical protein